LQSRPGTEDDEGYAVAGGREDAAGRRPRSAGTEQSMKPKAKAINSQQRPMSAVSSSIQMRHSGGSAAGVGGGGAGGSDGGRTSDDEGSYRTFTRGTSSAAGGMPSEGDGWPERGRDADEDVDGGDGYGYVYEDRDGGLVGEEERREMEAERFALKEGIGRAMERAEEAERMREEAAGRLEIALARVVALEGELESARGDVQAAKANAEAKMGLRQKQVMSPFSFWMKFPLLFLILESRYISRVRFRSTWFLFLFLFLFLFSIPFLFLFLLSILLLLLLLLLLMLLSLLLLSSSLLLLLFHAF